MESRLPLLCVLSAVLFGACGSRSSDAAPLPVAWDRAVLSKAPAIYPAPDRDQPDGVRALFYDGLPYKGKPTRVFAYLGIPDHKPGERLPAVVLVHGGGLTASAPAVRLWNSRGYVAIAMDTTGSTPGANGKRHEWGGPRGNGECFGQLNEPIPDQWMYHAVADVALANSLLRSLPEVDPQKVGLTGLSWGGVVTGVAAGVDNRFRWAAPVYGCGFLQESEYFARDLKGAQGEKWMALWDPSRYLGRATLPLLWINGTNDTFFQPPLWTRTLRLAEKAPRAVSLRVRMPHGGPDGERPEEIRAFADALCKNGEPLPRLSPLTTSGGTVSAAVKTRRRPVRAELCVTRDIGPWSKRYWETLPAELAPGKQSEERTVLATLPAGATAWFLRVVTEEGLAVTTEPQGLQDSDPKIGRKERQLL